MRSLNIPLHGLQKLFARITWGFANPKRRSWYGTGREIESVGKKVTRFKPGDPVFASTRRQFWRYVEFKCMPKRGDCYQTANLTFEQAAAVPGAGRQPGTASKRGKSIAGSKS